MTTIVSNSDIETFQKCERMFYYSRIMKVRPKSFPIFIDRGIFGHTLMEVGFQALLDGATVEEAIQKTGEPLIELMESDNPDKAELMKVYRHVSVFLGFTQQEDVGWKPIALEDKAMWPLNDDLVYAFTPDIVIEFTRGLSKGQRAVLDYKFLGQYMTETAIDMAQQIPKYIIYRNKMNPDEKIRQGAFVQLNTRAKADAVGHQLFLIKWVKPSKTRLERIEWENEQLVERVADSYKKEPKAFLRTVNKDVCDRCFFGKDLCPAEFDGKPIEKILEREYVKNDYGY